MKSYSEYKLLKEVGETPGGAAPPAGGASPAPGGPTGMPDPASGMPPIGGGPSGMPDLGGMGGGGGIPDLGGMGAAPGGDPNSTGPTLKINYNNVWDSIDKFLNKVTKDLKKT
jgi:hypothetical protein